jgi:ABC-type uncharacterized transport system permease subunit
MNHRSRAIAAAVLLPVISVVAGFVVAGLAVALSGADPLQSFYALYQGAFTNPHALPDTLVATTPYIFLGLGVALGFRAGLFNIGAEGQFYIGALFGVCTAYRPPCIFCWRCWREFSAAFSGPPSRAFSRHGSVPTKSSRRSC